MKFEFADDTIVVPAPAKNAGGNTVLPPDGISCPGTIDGAKLELKYSKMQDEIFFRSTAKYTVVPAGRRSGKTKGAAQSTIEYLLENRGKRVIWCDVAYATILTYYDIYFYPILSKLKSNLWKWDKQRRDLHIMDSTLSFRSADRPDLLVGFGYSRMIVNEVGIQFFEYPNIWTQILAPMLLDDPESRAWLIGTPRGLVGKNGKENLFWTMYKRGCPVDPEYDAKFRSYKYSSYDNPFLSKPEISELESQIPAMLRNQELYAEFLNTSELQIFKPEWWQFVDRIPDQASIERCFISVDSAFSEKTSADESAATVWVKTWDGHFTCIDCWHANVSYPDLVQAIKKLIVKHQPDNVVIENKASGQSLIQTLRNDLPEIGVVKFPPDGKKMGDKVSRATAITSYLESGKVKLLKAPWTNDFINQHTVFPLGDKDDIVDTCSQGLLWAKMSPGNASPFVTRKIVTSKLSDAVTSDTLRTFSLHSNNQYRGF